MDSPSAEPILILYHESDSEMGAWVTWQLEQAGIHPVDPQRDLVAGTNRSHVLEQAVTLCPRMLVIVSEAYLRSGLRAYEFAASSEDPLGSNRRLIPFLYQPCSLPLNLSQLVPIDIRGLGEPDAKQLLIASIGAVNSGAMYVGSRDTRRSHKGQPDFPAWSRELTQGWLPIPSKASHDVSEVFLKCLLASQTLGIHLLIGPDDAGKSTLARAAARFAASAGIDVQVRDLSQRASPPISEAAELVILDHLERIPAENPFYAAYTTLQSTIPTILATGTQRICVTVNNGWASQFMRVWRTDIESLMAAAVIDRLVTTWELREYSSEELRAVCHGLDLDPTHFDHPGLRLPGVVALARADAHSPLGLSTSRLRARVAARWIQSSTPEITRTARATLWETAGRVALTSGETAGFQTDAAEIGDHRALLASVDLPQAMDDPTANLTPFELRGGHVVFQSPGWADCAAAERLLAELASLKIPAITVAPLRASVIDAVLGLESAAVIERGLKLLFHDERPRSTFDEYGYGIVALGTLMTRVSRSFSFRDCDLRGPDHTDLPAPPQSAVDIVASTLSSNLEVAREGLFCSLSALPPETLTGWRGGSAFWMCAREWARGLPLLLESSLALDQVVATGSWQYEDILDVAITGATTSFMTGQRLAIEGALPSNTDTAEALADIWDGVNDGAWDQVAATQLGRVSHLIVRDGYEKLSLLRCSIQRAQFGNNDLAGWEFRDSDLRMADLRSCQGVSRADFAGSNWWAAILPPHDRYRMSRGCQDAAFLDWCREPPWQNPFWPDVWPSPFPPEARTE